MKLFNTEEEVNAYLGIVPVENPDLSWIHPQHQKAIIAVNKLFNIHEAHNKANGFTAKSKTNLYLIHDTVTNAVKIGLSKDVQSRFTQFQIATCNKLNLLYIIRNQGETEKYVHEKFKHLRLQGEWFEYHEDIIRYFQLESEKHNEKIITNGIQIHG